MMKAQIKALGISVKTFREVGMEAKWGKTSAGKPALFVRNPNSKLEHQRTKWWMLTKAMWNAIEKDGVIEGFERCTLLGDIFSIPA